jgi:hypothetical protein
MNLTEREKFIKEFKLKDMTSLQQRHFDTAYKAVNKEELHFVIENTDNRIIQDYAILKLTFFKQKENV